MFAKAVVLIALLGGANAYHLAFDGEWESTWKHSSDPKYSGNFVAEVPKGLSKPALKVTEKARHYGISTLLPKPVDPAQGLVLQFDLKLAGGLSCGGAYFKFVTADDDFTPTGLKDATPYTVMFGPDKCGSTNKVHLILRHTSPKGEIEEKHLKFPPSVETDDKTHVYTAILRASDNTYTVLVDGEEKKAGSLFEDFEPSFNPPETIPDPDDTKPADWVDEAKIVDPAAQKPEDWDEDAPMFIDDEEAEKPEGWLDDEPAEIDDPEATLPEDWDEEEDGEWEAPKVPNPKCKEAPGCGEWKRPTKKNPAYKGKWTAPMIDNPAYKGVWKPRDIPNPNFFKDDAPLTNIGKIGAAAIEIWTMDDNYFFDNLVVSNSEEEAASVREETWAPKKVVEDAAAEEEKVKKEAEEKETKAKEATAKPGFAETVQQYVGKVFDAPLLAPYAEALQPARTFLEDTPAAAVGVAALPLVLLLLLLLGRGKKVDTVGEAKKKDVTPADDKPTKPNGKKAKAEGEIEAEEDEEGEEEEEKTTARRRGGVRRD